MTSPAQLPIYALPQPPPQLATPPPAMPPMLMAAKPPVTPVELQQQPAPMVLHQPQQLLVPQQQQQSVYIKPAPRLATAQAQQQVMAVQGLPSSHVLRVPMSRLGTRSGSEVIISPEFPDPSSLKAPPPNHNTEFFSRVLSDTWWTAGLDTCSKQVGIKPVPCSYQQPLIPSVSFVSHKMDRSHLEYLSRNNVDSAYHCGQLARNLLSVECCRMIAVSRTTRLAKDSRWACTQLDFLLQSNFVFFPPPHRINRLRELMADIGGNK